MLRGLLYRLVGPTTVHLEYEFYLLCSLFLLTVSSLQGLYKDSFGTTRGDYIFLAFQCTWLAKHLLLRILCIWDPSTSRCPSIRGFCSHFLTCYLTGGQVFDRPSPKAMARQIGSTDYYTRQGGGGGGGGGMMSSNNSINALSNSSNFMSSLPPTLAYLVQIFKISVWFPLARIVDPPPFALFQRRRLQQQRLLLLQQQSNKSSLSSRSNSHNAPELARSTSRGGGGGGGGSSGNSGVGGVASTAVAATTLFRRSLHIMALYASIVWNNAPSFQFCLAWSATAFLAYNFLLYDVLQEQPNGPSALYNSGYNTAVKNEEDSIKRSGYYRPTLYVPDTIWSLFTLNVQFILLLTLTYFSRLILPIPDQIAGGNILKDARQEAKAAPKQTSSSSFSSSSYSGSGSGSSGSHHGGNASGVGFLTSLASKWFYPTGTSTSSSSSSKRSSFDHHHSANTELAWTEKSRPIVTESRWRVHALVLSIRLVDIWLSCGILPRTNSACYVMGHCPTTTRDVSMADMAHYLYPIGIIKALRDDIGFNPASAAAGTTDGIFAAASTTSGGTLNNHGWMTWIWSWMTSWWWLSPIAETLMGKTQIQDSFSAIWLTIDLIIIPLVLLCSQALLLNRSYLAIASYFSTEWTWIGPERSNHHSSSMGSSSSRSTGSIQQQQQQGANATVWDPRRKYKKDDVVVYGKNLFRAAFDQPEGRPAAMPIILRIFGLIALVLTGGGLLLQNNSGEGGHEVRKKTRSSSSGSTFTGFTRSANGFLQNALRNELGHPATSDVICMGSVLLLILTVIHLVIWLWCTMWNLPNSDGLFCAVAANMIACYAAVSVGSTKYNELNQLNREILAAAK